VKRDVSLTEISKAEFLPSPVYELMIATPGDHQFITACELAQAQYRDHFECELAHYYPKVFCLYKDDELVACCGFRAANEEALFLEQYLDLPIEQSVSLNIGQSIERANIVEIGGLAVTDKAEALVLMLKLAPAFQTLGFTLATCTVTTPVRRCLKKLGIESHLLASADPKRVSDGSDWGRYYDTNPVVLAGEIQPAIDRMAPLMSLVSQDC
jgi:hypothetical protein